MKKYRIVIESDMSIMPNRVLMRFDTYEQMDKAKDVYKDRFIALARRYGKRYNKQSVDIVGVGSFCYIGLNDFAMRVYI